MLNSNAKFKQILGQSHVDIWNMASKVNGHNGDCWWPVNVQNGSSAAAAAAPGRQASWPQSSSAVTMTARVFYNSGEQEARLGTARLQSRTTLQPVAWHEATAAEHRVKMAMWAQCTQLHMITKQQEEERERTGGAACTLLLLQAFCCRTLQLELKAVTVTHCLGSLCTSLPHIQYIHTHNKCASRLHSVCQQDGMDTGLTTSTWIGITRQRWLKKKRLKKISAVKTPQIRNITAKQNTMLTLSSGFTSYLSGC